ncbi:hypothetical protein IWZ00DRAFT_30355 [Phyllosticta capitalensis]|uniref:uncharacterized protein n=1 Tax=Phyllosticta capitalensis TaxID=121624 RepID=UPI00312E0C33
MASAKSRDSKGRDRLASRRTTRTRTRPPVTVSAHDSHAAGKRLLATLCRRRKMFFFVCRYESDPKGRSLLAGIPWSQREEGGPHVGPVLPNSLVRRWCRAEMEGGTCMLATAWYARPCLARSCLAIFGLYMRIGLGFGLGLGGLGNSILAY